MEHDLDIRVVGLDVVLPGQSYINCQRGHGSDPVDRQAAIENVDAQEHRERKHEQTRGEGVRLCVAEHLDVLVDGDRDLEGDVPSFRYTTIGPPDCKTAFDRLCQDCYLLFANHFHARKNNSWENPSNCTLYFFPGRTLQTVSSLTTFYHFKRLFFSFMCYAPLTFLYCFPPTCHPLIFIV